MSEASKLSAGARIFRGPWGGTQFFLDGGEQALMGEGADPLKGMVPP